MDYEQSAGGQTNDDGVHAVRHLGVGHVELDAGQIVVRQQRSLQCGRIVGGHAADEPQIGGHGGDERIDGGMTRRVDDPEVDRLLAAGCDTGGGGVDTVRVRVCVWV